MDRRDFLRFSLYTFLYAAVPARASSVPVIVNPGHNRRNPGCAFPGVGAEYQITPHIAHRVHEGLSDMGFDAAMTRHGETYISRLREYVRDNSERLRILFRTIIPAKRPTRRTLSLEERIAHVGMAEWIDVSHSRAAVHIHVNDAPNGNRGRYSGYSVIVSDNNRVYAASMELAKHIHHSLDKDFEPSNNPNEAIIVSNGGKRLAAPGFIIGDFLVLGSDYYRPLTPSVIVECGYITERYGGKSIADAGVQERYAKAIAEGTALFLKRRDA